jgi:diguanylate cyclase (GGDEF)-like protein
LKRFNAISVLVCLLAFSAAIQAQQYIFRSLRQVQGLNNLAVNALTTDRFGFLWVATENGVFRFLGSGFEQYGKEKGIAERDIEDIYADPNGTVWAGTDANLYRWDGSRFLAAGKTPIQVNGAQRLVAEDARNLLVVDQHRLYRLEHDTEGRMLSYAPVFSDATLASIPELSNLSSVSVTGGHTLWMGCGAKLCSWLDGREGTVKVWGTDKGVPRNVWHSVLLDHAGTIWAAGQQHHVVMLPAGATRFVDRNFPGPDLDSVYQHGALAEDREGRVIVSTEDGIALWEGGHWRLIGPANGLRTGHITSVAFDTVGDLWLGGFGYGLYHWFGREDWEGWNELGGLPSANVLSTFPIREDRVLVGTEKGPAWINPTNGSAGPLFPGHRWTYGQVSGLGINPDSSAWATTYSGAILSIDQKTNRVKLTAKLPALIAGAVQDPAGRVFFSTAGGIYMREAEDPNAQPHRIPSADALLGDSTRINASCVAPDGAVWFLAKNQLLREQKGAWTVPPTDGLQKVSGRFLYLSCGADGALWLTGQQTGIWRLTLSGPRLKAWRLVTPPEFKSLAPLAILADRRGWVWQGTDWGLIVWNGREWRHLAQESGLIWNDVNKGTLTNGPDGSVWVETSGGLAHLTHPERVFDSQRLIVSVTDIERGNQVYPVAQQLTLPWASLPLRFRISSPVMRDRSDLTFKYRMEGLQPQWTETQDGSAVFSALPPGNYTFMAVAHNPGLNSYSTTVTVHVLILPPWWRSLWFYCLCGLVFVFLLVAADKLRARHLRQESRNLESLIRQRTRELEASREKLRIQATHDGLTEMLNRVAILRALSVEMDRAQREKRSVVVALVDLDHFKRINDAYGHLAGDEALRSFAAAVKVAIRAYDHAGRYGGEEFLLVLTEIPREAVELRLSSLHASISNLQVCAHEAQFRIDCSMGATIFDPSNGPATVESLLAIADLALYAAKDEGRNRVVYCPTDSRGDQQKPYDQLSRSL